MKLFVKLMLALLVVAMFLPFTFLKGKDGRPLMSLSDIGLPSFSMPDLPDFPSARQLAPSIEGMEGQVVFYKWYNTEGDVQFTTEPPTQGIEYTVKGFDPNANVIQAVKVPPKDSATGTTGSTHGKSSGSKDLGSPYSQEAIKKLFEDAENIENVLKQRLKDQDSALNQ